MLHEGVSRCGSGLKSVVSVASGARGSYRPRPFQPPQSLTRPRSGTSSDFCVQASEEGLSKRKQFKQVWWE